MNYSVAVLALVGAISTSQAVQLSNSMVLSVNLNELSQNAEALDVDKATLQSVEAAKRKATEAKANLAE